MIVAIDGIAHRYGLLPSEVMARASTFDLQLFDAATTYHQYQHDKVMNNGVAPVQDYTQTELLEIMKKAKQ